MSRWIRSVTIEERRLSMVVGVCLWIATTGADAAPRLNTGDRAADAWEEDLRRCRVLKQFSQGGVIISAGEKMVELNVYWSDGANLDNLGPVDISVRIDDAPLPDPKPLKSDYGVLYGFGLGSFNAILPRVVPR